MVLQLLFFAFVIVTIIQLVFWLLVYRRLQQQPIEQAEPAHWPTVSVVVCARNTAEALRTLIPTLLSQDYPAPWQLILVDDASTDQTAVLLHGMDNAQLVVVTIHEKQLQGKKQALDAGIRAAQHEIILVTDADCLPVSEYWIQEMVKPLARAQYQLVLGFAPFYKKSGWLYAWQRYETCYNALLYMSWALRGMPYMGVGRNMAYRKTLYTGSGGFASHADLPSGDDDLFVNAIAQKGEVAVVLHPDSFMYSEAKPDWKSYYSQKTRHFTTGPRYQVWHKILLSVAGLSHSLHYFFMLLLLLAQAGTVFVLVIALIRIIIIILVCKPVLRRFHEQKLLTWLPVFDPFIAVYYTVFIPSTIISTFNKPRSWT
jgi:poly-beta-1,6-N-acetyl-D-glucosamine synthase